MQSLANVAYALRIVTARGWATALVLAVASMLAIGIPTAIVETPVFGREVPVRPQDYAIWVATGALILLVAATFTLPAEQSGSGFAWGGGLLSFIAVGCPVCNKLVLLALGTTGALNIFGPVQLYLGLTSLVLLAYTLVVRARVVVEGCPIPTTAAASGAAPSR